MKNLIPRFPFPVPRFPFPVSHFPFPVPRIPFHVARFPIRKVMNKKILLIDDDIDLVEINRVALEAAGFEVASAYDSESGLEAFERFLPDVVFVDLVMEHPDSGFRLCRALDKHTHGSSVCIVMLTSAAHETGYRFSIETSEERKWIKADYYLEKPVSPTDLVHFLKEKILKPRGVPSH